VDVGRLDADEVRQDAHPFVEIHERGEDRILEPWTARVVQHRVAVQRARPGKALFVPLEALAVWAHRSRRVAQLPADRAALRDELVT
jgi:hypothetical protein